MPYFEIECEEKISACYTVKAKNKEKAIQKIKDMCNYNLMDFELKDARSIAKKDIDDCICILDVDE